jgi:hypothetical protein
VSPKREGGMYIPNWLDITYDIPYFCAGYLGYSVFRRAEKSDFDKRIKPEEQPGISLSGLKEED